MCFFLCAKTQTLVDMANHERGESKANAHWCTAINEPNRCARFECFGLQEHSQSASAEGNENTGRKRVQTTMPLKTSPMPPGTSSVSTGEMIIASLNKFRSTGFPKQNMNPLAITTWIKMQVKWIATAQKSICGSQTNEPDRVGKYCGVNLEQCLEECVRCRRRHCREIAETSRSGNIRKGFIWGLFSEPGEFGWLSSLYNSSSSILGGLGTCPWMRPLISSPRLPRSSQFSRLHALVAKPTGTESSTATNADWADQPLINETAVKIVGLINFVGSKQLLGVPIFHSWRPKMCSKARRLNNVAVRNTRLYLTEASNLHRTSLKHIIHMLQNLLVQSYFNTCPSLLRRLLLKEVGHHCLSQETRFLFFFIGILDDPKGSKT